MKKRNATTLSEILYTDINGIGDNTELFQIHLYKHVLGISSGVIYGLAVTQNGASGIYCASGSLVDNTYAFGELEGTSGVSLSSLPTSGTRVDTVSARYSEVADSPGTSYILIDVDSRTQTTSTVYRRKIGSIVVEVNQDTASGALTGNRIPIASLSVTSGGIQTVTDLRTFVKPTNFDTTTIQNLASGATVGGDVSGTVANITIKASAISGKSVSGDLSGTIGNATVTKIQGYPVSGTLTSGQFLYYNGSSIISAGSGATVTLAGDVSGDSSANTVDKIKNISVSGTYSAGKTLVHNGTVFNATTVPTGVINSSAFSASGQHWVYDGTNLVPELQLYDIAGGCVGKPSATGIVLNFVAVRTLIIPSGGAGFKVKAQTSATSDATFTIYKNGSSIGTFKVAAGATTATMVTWTGSTQTLVAGDYLVVKAPTTQDSTLADLAITFKATVG